ncbi:MAG: hypothetical protein JRF71_17040 [Deltaproteobacteria bacterium]|nr:hypothetical protein [Deltaproteobacteria bacterium]
MRKIIIILTGVMTITVLTSLNLAMATKENTGVEVGHNSQKASLSVTPEEMRHMSELLENMVNEIKSGNMTPEIHAKSAKILIHVSHILDALANPDDKVTYSITKHQNKEVERKWNPWDEMVEH